MNLQTLYGVLEIDPIGGSMEDPPCFQRRFGKSFLSRPPMLRKLPRA
jgi:hypothetical protein